MTLKELMVSFMVLLLVGVSVVTWKLEERAGRRIVQTTETVSTIAVVMTQLLHANPEATVDQLQPQLVATLAASNLDAFKVKNGRLLDVWGNEMRIDSWTSGGHPVVDCQSPGPDGKLNTADDIGFTYNSNINVWSGVSMSRQNP
jgi:hypothetical protein